MPCKMNLTREGERRTCAKESGGWGARVDVPNAFFMCDAQLSIHPVQKQLSNMFAVTHKYAHTSSRNPDKARLDIITIFFPSRWSSSLHAFPPFLPSSSSPPRKCQPLRLSAPKQIAPLRSLRKRLRKLRAPTTHSPTTCHMNTRRRVGLGRP